ncbi:MAG TPA: histidine kinase [Lapillicoccus sp.]|nr:histidine kinase [Lapillicoccus sp.]
MTSVAAPSARSSLAAAGTSLRDALVAIGVIMAALVLTEYVVPSQSAASVAAIVDVIAVAAFTVTGLVAWHRRPHNRTGRLMVAAALALWAAGMQGDEIEVLSRIGVLLDSLPLAVLIHLLLAFPSGRLVDRPSRITVTVGYVIALAPPVLQELTDSELTDSEPAVTAIGTAQTAIGIATLLVTFVVASRRLSQTPAVLRRQLLPFVGYGCFALTVIAVCVALSHADLSTAALDAVLIVQVAMICGLPIAFVIAMTGGAFGRAGEVEEVALGISEASAEPALLDDLMVRALGDPSARVLWATSGGFVDSGGHPRDIAASTGWWPVGTEPPPVGGLTYDRGLVADTGLVATVAAPLELAIDNRRLVVDLRSAVQQLDEAAEQVRSSRRRIVVAADAERRRIARDLHDGAQQRILLVGLEIQRLARRPDDPDVVRSVAARVGDQCRALLADLRSLVQGIMPATLHERGLHAAVVALAEQMPIPVRVVTGELDRMDAEVESTGYFVVAEGLTNAIKHANAEAVEVAMSVRDDRLEVVVTDDGQGPQGAPPGFGLRSLGDRVAALDGTLDLRAAPVRGTTLRAEFVCA